MAEEAARTTATARTDAEHAYRAAVEREAAAREDLAAQATRTVRLSSVDDDLGRLETEVDRVVGELALREQELDEAEAAFRQADARRREVEDVRRHLAEEAAGRRAEMETLQSSLAGSERDRERLEGSLREVRERITAAETEQEDLTSDIEHMDGQSSPLSERRAALDGERRKIVDKLEELEEIRRRQESRRDLLEARRQDIEETAGSRFLKGHRRQAIGLLRDLVRVESGLSRALVAALGPLADAVVYTDGDRALADAGEGDGAILAIAGGGPVAAGLAGERSLLSVVDAEPAARGIASTVLRDVYLVETVEEASRKQDAHPTASFVTPDGVLVGPAVIHTAAVADARAREIRAELQVLEHDLGRDEERAQAAPRAAR